MPPRVEAGRLHTLTMLRFAAAFWVVIFHLQSRVPLRTGEMLHHFLANGAFAMTFFFVLSGTMLAYGYQDLSLRGPEVISYFRARFARIVPAYVVLHLCALFLFTPTVAGGAIKWLYINVLSAAGVQAWFPHAMPFGANAGTWSISVEFFFYALFPAMLVVLRWARIEFGTMRLLVYGWLATSLAGLSEYVFNAGLIYYVLPSARLPEFFLGVVLGLTLVESSKRRVPVALLGAAVLATLAACDIPVTRYGSWTIANFVVVPTFAWLIFTMGRFEQQHRVARSQAFWRPFIYLGESSYCLFLAHLLPMLYLDSSHGQAWKAQAVRDHGQAWVWTLTIAASLLGAIALHEAVEKPARQALNRRWRARDVARAAGLTIVGRATVKS